jgi:hypothetical protein
LMISECANGAIFIRECLAVVSKQVDMSSLGLTAHPFEPPDDLCELSVIINGETHTVHFNPQKTAAEFALYLSGLVRQPAEAMVMYRGNDAIRPSAGDRDFTMRRYFEALARPGAVPDPFREGPWSKTIIFQSAVFQPPARSLSTFSVSPSTHTQPGRRCCGCRDRPLDERLFIELLALTEREMASLDPSQPPSRSASPPESALCHRTRSTAPPSQCLRTSCGRHLSRHSV